MKFLNSLYTKIITIVVLFVLFAAGGVNYYTKVQSDAKYLAKADTISATDLFYTKTQSNANFINESGDTISGVILAPTAAAGTKTQQLATTAFAKNEDRFNDNFLNQLKLMGFTGNNIPIGSYTTNAGLTMTDGRIQYVTFVAKKDTTLQAFKFMMLTSGSYTADNTNNIALLTVSTAPGNTTWTKVAESANDGNLWKSGTTEPTTVSLTTPVSVTKGQKFKIAIIWNASATTTAPAIMQFGTQSVSAVETGFFPAKDYISARSAGAETSIPSSIGVGGVSPSSSIIAIWY